MEKKISQIYLTELEKEIDGLIERLTEKEKRENEYLRERIKILELENLRLNNILYGGKENFNLVFIKKDNNLIN